MDEYWVKFFKSLNVQEVKSEPGSKSISRVASGDVLDKVMDEQNTTSKSLTESELVYNAMDKLNGLLKSLEFLEESLKWFSEKDLLEEKATLNITVSYSGQDMTLMEEIKELRREKLSCLSIDEGSHYIFELHQSVNDQKTYCERFCSIINNAITKYETHCERYYNKRSSVIFAPDPGEKGRVKELKKLLNKSFSIQRMLDVFGCFIHYKLSSDSDCHREMSVLNNYSFLAFLFEALRKGFNTESHVRSLVESEIRWRATENKREEEFKSFSFSFVANYHKDEALEEREKLMSVFKIFGELALVVTKTDDDFFLVDIVEPTKYLK